MYRIDVGLDLGTSKVCVYMRDKGIVINQPSVLAYEKKVKESSQLEKTQSVCLVKQQMI